VWRKRDLSLADVVEVLQGIGRMLQEIDAKLQKIVDLLAEEYE
jgi:hypothetical protein